MPRPFKFRPILALVLALLAPVAGDEAADLEAKLRETTESSSAGA